MDFYFKSAAGQKSELHVGSSRTYFQTSIVCWLAEGRGEISGRESSEEFLFKVVCFIFVSMLRCNSVPWPAFLFRCVVIRASVLAFSPFMVCVS